MGQRHQYIVIYPEKYLGEGNPNNRPAQAEVIHHQWLYGRNTIRSLERVLTLVANTWDGEGTDYLFGRGDSGYRGSDGTDAIAAALSVCPEEGYYHNVHIWDEKSQYSGTQTAAFDPKDLETGQFDNNDGVTVIRFELGERLPSYCFVTPGHLEGPHWSGSVGRGPWSAREYLEFYYSPSEQAAWPQEVQDRMATAFKRIEENSILMDRREVAKLLPHFKLSVNWDGSFD
jgi:hypothetical protein